MCVSVCMNTTQYYPHASSRPKPTPVMLQTALSFNAVTKLLNQHILQQQSITSVTDRQTDRCGGLSINSMQFTRTVRMIQNHHNAGLELPHHHTFTTSSRCVCAVSEVITTWYQLSISHNVLHGKSIKYNHTYTQNHKHLPVTWPNADGFKTSLTG